MLSATLSLPIESSETRQGVVTAKASRSMTVLESSGTSHVVVTERPDVAGHRNSYAHVAINGVVR